MKNIDKLLELDWFQTSEDFADSVLWGDQSGHDLYHALRTVNNAVNIMQEVDNDKVNPNVVVLASLLHDTIDSKIITNPAHAEAELRELLLQLCDDGHLTIAEYAEVLFIVKNMSFSKNFKSTNINFQIVQDADLLEAVGYIGVVRTSLYTGYLGDGDLKGTIRHYRDRTSKVIDRFNIEECYELYSVRFEKTKTFFLQLEEELR